MNQPVNPRKGRAGRPTKAQTVARHAELLDQALNHFLEKGFEGATVEAIAASVQMTKRTIYTRYPDKESLFLAAVFRAIEYSATPQTLLEAAVTENLEETLRGIARLRVNQVMTPSGVKLQRIINTESYRFPEIFRWSYEYGAQPVIRFLSDLLDKEIKAGRLALEDPFVAANLFISMVVSGPVRIAVSGNEVTRDEVDQRIKAGVRVFLYGAVPR